MVLKDTANNIPKVIQCDFDGTVTDGDASFILLDMFADGDWRAHLTDYQEGRITVGQFNSRAFAMIKSDERRLLDALSGRVVVKPGFRELVTYCDEAGMEFVIVSNGLDFYIKAILLEMGLERVPIYAAKTWFPPEGLRVQYIGPDNTHLDDGFKEAFVESFLQKGYHVMYTGNGPSDFPAAKRCQRIFATGELLSYCKREKVACTAFTDFNDIINALEATKQA